MTATLVAPRTDTELITPDRATALLLSNTGNRTIRPAHVQRLANAMRDGEFKFNGDTIRISASNRLLDGQHRLHAIVQSGISIPMLVVYGIPDDAADTIDQNANRTVADILKIRGIEFPNVLNVNSTAAILVTGTRGTEALARDRRLLAEYVAHHHEEISPWVTFAWAVSQNSPMVTLPGVSKSRRSITVSPLAALVVHMVREGADPNTVESFFQGVAQGFNLDPEVLQKMRPSRLSVLQALHRRMLNGYPLARTGGGSHAGLMSEYPVYINAYNKYVKGETMKMARSNKVPMRYWDELPLPTNDPAE